MICPSLSLPKVQHSIGPCPRQPMAFCGSGVTWSLLGVGVWDPPKTCNRNFENFPFRSLGPSNSKRRPPETTASEPNHSNTLLVGPQPHPPKNAPLRPSSSTNITNEPSPSPLITTRTSPGIYAPHGAGLVHLTGKEIDRRRACLSILGCVWHCVGACFGVLVQSCFLFWCVCVCWSCFETPPAAGRELGASQQKGIGILSSCIIEPHFIYHIMTPPLL